MCAIIGALVWDLDRRSNLDETNHILSHIWRSSFARGRDGRGYVVNTNRMTTGQAYRCVEPRSSEDRHIFFECGHECETATFIANLRAEPTTEYVAKKNTGDQQPYRVWPWTIVHNGTIANDKEVRTHFHPTKIDSAAIAEVLAKREAATFDQFCASIETLKGSYAIIAQREDATNEIFVAANYRPIWYIETEFGVFFASARDYFPKSHIPKMLTPYTAMHFSVNADGWLETKTASLLPPRPRKRALVVCSGGLDSVVSATWAQKIGGFEIELLHFKYGSRAEGPEVIAVAQCALALGCAHTIFPLPVYKPSDSPLLQKDSKIAGGEAGAEFAYEWVPARNLLLLSVATAYAEANGFDTIVLGNNLEEAGAYPDNEPEFIAKFNDLLPFAVGDGKQLEVIMPVGNMMKHEIVHLGNQLEAPLDLTWSCYRAGHQHCGTCGPCYMRRTAFEINGLPEVISYEA